MKRMFFCPLLVGAFAAVAAPDRAFHGETTVPVGDVRVGFSLDTAKREASKRAKRGVVVGSPHAYVTAGSITHAQMKSLSVTTNGNVVTATWKGHPECGDDFTVTAKMALLPDGGFEYTSFGYAGNKDSRLIQRISFPEVTVPRTDKTAIFRPNTVGEVFRPDWNAFPSGKDVSASGANWLTFSCIAALNDGGTSHFLDHRGEARLHTVSFAVVQGSEPGTLVLCNRYAPPMTDERKTSGALPYTGVYAPYCGGWYEAAKMHRAWLETTPWFKKAAARDFSKLRAVDLWMWSRGGVEVSEPPVHWFMKETGLKVALDWYWWHGIPYDTSFPYFWPPRDGVEGFRAAVKRMKDRGAFVQVYTNGASWDCDDPRWDEDGGPESVIVVPSGRLFAKMYNVFTRHRLARICGEAPKFQGIIRKLERNLRESGLDGVYMDQISCGAHSSCCNPRHAHAPGGDAVEKGYRAYVQTVRDDNPGFILSSEATSETYFDLFEASILLYSSWERCGKGSLPRSEPVPAVSVIYRGAAVVFGSFATPGGAPAWDPMWGEKPDGDEVEAVVAKYPDQFAVEFARGIVWGIQPMVHNFTMKDVENPRLAKDLQFMKDSAKFYHDNRDFLFDGELLKPATLTCATKRVEFLSASCYRRVKDSSTFVQEALPTVFHSEWRAKDGRKAAILVNWTREEQKYEIEFDGVKRRGALPALSWRLLPLKAAERPVEVRVRQTPQGPRIFVDGVAVRPRFYYGSAPCLCPISDVRKLDYTIPFRPEEDTDRGRVSLDGFDDDEPMWFSEAKLIDKTAGTTVRLSSGGEERTRHFVRDGLHLRKGHLYHFVVTHRSTHHRTYFTHEASYTDAAGRKVVMPLPYGDTLGDTVRLAADAQVDFVTFSTDISWGCMDWWAPPGEPPAYGRIDRAFEHVIAANPNALIVPRVCADAPGWMLERDPSLRMVFDKGYPVRMSSVSARPYRKAACEAVERLTRHLRAKFPRNFAGLHVSGQNSAEWFYMMSQSGELSGYDVHTRDAFRAWLAKRGEKDAWTAEVPSPEARRVKRPQGRLDPVLDRRAIQFGEFRQEEMASLLCDLGAAVRRGSDGGSLAIFFYGYTWELGAVVPGAAETGHFFVDWIMRHGKDCIDGFSAPFSYTGRGWPGLAPVMAPSETFMRNGFLWINEDDTRTHLEDLWSFPVNVGLKNKSPFVTRNALLRNGALDILRGHGDWWMDLCGRGWFRDAEMWKIRKALNALDDAMLRRRKPYSPEIALVVDERSLMRNGFGSSKEVTPQLHHARFRLNLCGATHGQYLLDDVLANPPDCKLLLVAYARDLEPARRARLEEMKRAHPTMRVVEAATPHDVVTEKIVEHAQAAGVHFYTQPLKATVCAAEGYVVVQAREEGPLEVDFGNADLVVDFLAGRQVGVGPKVSLPFRKGETRIFRLASR